jgi:capsular polysaccharide biosynthesis protein
MPEKVVFRESYVPASFERKGLTNKPELVWKGAQRRSETRTFEVVLTDDDVYYSSGVYVDARTVSPLQAFSAAESHFVEAASAACRSGPPSRSCTTPPGSIFVLCGYPGSDFNYGHYLTDVLAPILYFKQRQRDLANAMVPVLCVPLPRDQVLTHAVRSLHAHLRIQEKEIHWIVDRTLVMGPKVFFRDARIHAFAHAPWIIEALQSSAGISERKGTTVPRCLFIQRGAARDKARDISENSEARVVELVREVIGSCDKVNPVGMPPAELFSAISCADVVVGVMGANMTNLVAARPGAHALFLTPMKMPGTYYLDVCSCLRVTYHEYRVEQLAPSGDQNVAELSNEDFVALRTTLLRIRDMIRR